MGNILSIADTSAPLLPIVSQFVLVWSLICLMPLLASSCKTNNIKINLQKIMSEQHFHYTIESSESFSLHFVKSVAFGTFSSSVYPQKTN